MLSDEVTKFLPQEWSKINSAERSKKWILDREAESSVNTVSIIETQKLAGLIILIDVSEDIKIGAELQLGFLLSKEYWGKGYGNEIISGLVSWCKEDRDIYSITGGVMNGNHASEIILKNNGFTNSNIDSIQNVKFYTLKIKSKK
ncbi:MAG: GNAT family N-acetyltransferase [Nitrospinales bacterium]